VGGDREQIDPERGVSRRTREHAADVDHALRRVGELLVILGELGVVVRGRVGEERWASRVVELDQAREDPMGVSSLLFQDKSRVLTLQWGPLVLEVEDPGLTPRERFLPGRDGGVEDLDKVAATDEVRRRIARDELALDDQPG